MSTTIFPINSGGPLDDDYGPKFPSSAGRGMGFKEFSPLRESAGGVNKSKEPKVKAKTFLKAAEGKAFKGKKKVKKGSKPENLRASEAKNQKKGAFGEKYAASKGNTGKGVRVAESGRYLANGKKKSLAQRQREGFYPEIR